MQLRAITVQMFHNFVEPQRIEIEPDVTCLVGKNESGKTTILKALHRLKPANGSDTKFNLTTEYPRWRLAADRRKNPDLAAVQPIVAEFEPDDKDLAILGDAFGVRPPAGIRVFASKSYSNGYFVWTACSVDRAVASAWSTAAGDDETPAFLLGHNKLTGAIAAARTNAHGLQDSGDTAGTKVLTTTASLLEKYDPFVSRTAVTPEQTAAIAALVPKFFYFSQYNVLPGEVDLTNLAARLEAHEAPADPERTVVALLAHAGEKPSDFLDENYDSRKAELQAASVDLSRQVSKYWRQNSDLTVVFDTDNVIVQTDPAGNQTAHRFLKVELRDARHGDVETNFSTRSNGFQWFFSFFAAFSEYRDSNDSVVVLLDEPGMSLHGDAQRDFVRYIFDELGRSKQTIYTTHSQNMVDPTRYEKLRAAHDRATRENPDLGVVVTLPSLSADRATILPIESALGYSLSRHLFLGSGQHLAVEGSSDSVYLQRITEHLDAHGRHGLDPRLEMIPVGGADNMPAFVALLGRRLKVSALVDGASTSSKLDRVRAAARASAVPESSIVACSEIPFAPTNADIEDLFELADYLKLYNWTFNTSITVSDLAATTEPVIKKLTALRGSDYDHALPAHALTARRAEFFANVSAITLANFEALFDRLNGTIQETA